MRTLGYVILAASLVGCAVQSATIPGPPQVNITPPAANLDPDLAAFSGTWEGTWHTSGFSTSSGVTTGAMSARLIVEKIDAQSAQLVYAWSDDTAGRYRGGWTRVRASVSPDKSLEFGGDVKFALRLQPDRQSMKVTRRSSGYALDTTFRKVAEKPVAAPAAAAAAVATAAIPGPTDIKIVPPAPGLAPDLAAFSGIWEGAWDDSQVPARLIVERIETDSARVVYGWADSPKGSVKAGWTRRSAKVLPDAKIEWGSEPRLTFTMGKDRLSLEGEWEKGGIISTAIMKRVGK